MEFCKIVLQWIYHCILLSKVVPMMGNLLALKAAVFFVEFSKGYKVTSYFEQKSVSLQYLLMGLLRR